MWCRCHPLPLSDWLEVVAGFCMCDMSHYREETKNLTYINQIFRSPERLISSNSSFVSEKCCSVHFSKDFFVTKSLFSFFLLSFFSNV